MVRLNLQEITEKRLHFCGIYYIINLFLPLWWNWQTRWTQNPVVVIPYRFDPDQRHQKKNEQETTFSPFPAHFV